MDQSQEAPLKIGQIASRAGVSVDTVRYYEQRGILPPPARLASGYRTYPPSAADRIILARRLRALGMTIDEVVAALAGHDPGGTCASETWRLEAVRDRTDAQLAQLTALRDLLSSVIDACANDRCQLAVGLGREASAQIAGRTDEKKVQMAVGRKPEAVAATRSLFAPGERREQTGRPQP